MILDGREKIVLCRICQFYKKEFPLTYSSEDGLTAQHVIDEIYKLIIEEIEKFG